MGKGWSWGQIIAYVSIQPELVAGPAEAASTLDRSGARDPEFGGRQVSYSTDVKAELCELTAARWHCQEHEVAAILRATGGLVTETGGVPRANFSRLPNAVARKIVRLAHARPGLEVKVQRAGAGRKTLFDVELLLNPSLQSLLAAGPAELPKRACDRKAMLRGFFLGCGSVNAPVAHYHLELVPADRAGAVAAAEILHLHGVRAGLGERGGRALVYVKDGDGIARTLSLIGANRAVLEFEKARVLRELTGEVNRRLNFETANIAKTIGAASRQLDAIERLTAAGRLRQLSPALRSAARVRRAHPDLNLDDMALRMDLSKSALNHRLRRLVELSKGGAGKGYKGPFPAADPLGGPVAGAADPKIWSRLHRT